MPPVLTVASTVSCDHAPGGSLTLTGAAAAGLSVDGNAVLAGSLAAAPIGSGCSQPASSTTAPCTASTGQTAGPAQVLSVNGAPVLLATAAGTTSSMAPGTWSAKDAKQTVLGAV